jgi:hypothetical protein
MSQFPRRLLTDTAVSWDPHANGAARSTFTRHGTVIDVVPGSALERAYGNGNLSGVIPLGQRGDEPGVSHVCVSNLWD